MENERIVISNVQHRHINRFNLDTIQFAMHFAPDLFESLNFQALPNQNNNANNFHIMETYIQCFSDLLEFVRVHLNVSPQDRIGYTINIPSMDTVTAYGYRMVQYQESVKFSYIYKS